MPVVTGSENLCIPSVTSAPPSGAAGGDLAGTYPNPTLNSAIATPVTWTGIQMFNGGPSKGIILGNDGLNTPIRLKDATVANDGAIIGGTFGFGVQNGNYFYSAPAAAASGYNLAGAVIFVRGGQGIWKVLDGNLAGGTMAFPMSNQTSAANFAPSTNSKYWRCAGTSITINTIPAGIDGEEHIIVNVDATNLTIANGGSGTGKSITTATGSNIVLKTNEFVHVVFDATSDVWRADSTGNIASFSVVGTTTNDNAAAGYLGQFTAVTRNEGSATGLTSTTPKDVLATMSLTPGDWDVEGNINFILTGATVTEIIGGIGVTSVTIPGDGSEVYCGVVGATLTLKAGLTLQRQRISINTTTTIYLVAKATFSLGTVSAFGTYSARRVR